MNDNKSVAQILAEARQRDETLSELVRKYPTDLDGILKKLDSMLGELTEQRRPQALLELRAHIEGVSARAQQVVSSAGGGVNWNYLMGAVNPPRETASTQKIALPESIRDGTQEAEVYRAIAGGTTSIRELKNKFPKYSVSSIVNTLKHKKGVIESAEHGKIRIKAQDNTATAERPQETAGVIPGSISDRLLSYLGGIDGEKTYDEIFQEPQFSDVNRRVLTSYLGRLKRKGFIEGGKGRARKKGPPPETSATDTLPKKGEVAARAKRGTVRPVLMAYLEEHVGDIPYSQIIRDLTQKGVNKNSIYGELTNLKRTGVLTGAHGVAKYAGEKDVQNRAVAGSPILATHATIPVAVPVDYSGQLAPYYTGSIPDFVRELSIFETSIEKIPEEYLRRIYNLVIAQGILPEDPEAVTMMHVNAIHQLGEALRSYADERSLELFLRNMESRGRIEPRDMERYLNEFTSAITLPQESADIKGSTTLMERDLSSYLNISTGMDVIIHKLNNVIAANPGEVGNRIEKYVFGLLPQDATKISPAQYGAVSAIAVAFKEAVNFGGSIEPLLAYLESKKADPAKVPQYLSEFFGEPIQAAAPVTNRVSVIGQPDLSNGPYWRVMFSQHGEMGQMLERSVPYILSRDGRFDDVLQNFLGDGHDYKLNAWKPYALQQMAYFMEKVEQEMGSIPPEVYTGFLGLLKPYRQAYFQRVYRMVGKKGHLSTQQGIELLTDTIGKGDNAIDKILSGYSRL